MNEKHLSDMPKQHKYCIEHKIPMFAHDECFHCGKKIEDTDKELITGCKHCCTSFVE